MEIIAWIQRSKIGIQDWSLSDLTVGLYLIYLRQASTYPFEDIKGIQISSESIVISETHVILGSYTVMLAYHYKLLCSTILINISYWITGSRSHLSY